MIRDEEYLNFDLCNLNVKHDPMIAHYTLCKPKMSCLDNLHISTITNTRTDMV